MGFMGMVFAGFALVILIVILFFMFAFLLTAIILKIVGKKKNSISIRAVGNVFLILSIIFAVPPVLLVGVIAFNNSFIKVTLPDGKETYVSTAKTSTMRELASSDSDEDIQKLDKLLSKNHNLVYYLDTNCKSVLDYGLERGNSDVVEIALKNGAEFDNPNRYDRMIYETSMDYYLSCAVGREITEDDVEIVNMMFENDVSTDFEDIGDYSVYSNPLGKAVWAVLYNDGSVSDTELEFICTFVDNGLSSDEGLLLYEEKPSNVFFSPEYKTDVIKDDNYDELMTLIGHQ